MNFPISLRGKKSEITENFPLREKHGKYRDFPREGNDYIIIFIII